MVTTRRTVTLHGHRMAWIETGPRLGGRGFDGRASEPEVVVLIHGVAGSSATWTPVIERLERDGSPRRVIAPDLLGHGESAGPSGDFSMGAYANGLRDLLAALGHRRATVVGHSLGGGVAMQFAYQFPEMCSRLVLVSSGGLGRGVARRCVWPRSRVLGSSCRCWRAAGCSASGSPRCVRPRRCPCARRTGCR